MMLGKRSSPSMMPSRAVSTAVVVRAWAFMPPLPAWCRRGPMEVQAVICARSRRRWPRSWRPSPPMRAAARWRRSAVFDVVYADGDAALPRQMKSWATQGVSLLQGMVAAEMADLMNAALTEEAMALAAGPLPDAAYDALVKAVAADSPAGRALAKVGARNSRADQERIQHMHDDARSLGATCESAEKAVSADLTKGSDAIEAARAELAKMTVQRDALQKTLTDEVLPQIAALAKMVGTSLFRAISWAARSGRAARVIPVHPTSRLQMRSATTWPR